MKAAAAAPSLSLWQRLLLHLPLDPQLLVKTGAERSRHLNRQLAWPLAFAAGAVNAGGYMAIQVYTSHVTGSLSQTMDAAALGRFGVTFFYFGIIGAFLAGSATSTVFIHLGTRQRYRSPYGGAMFFESLLLLLFGAVAQHRPFPAAAQSAAIGVCLAFFMGFLNAIATIISRGEVRVTNMTGNVTDIGIELGKLLYWNRHRRRKAVRVAADRRHLRLLAGSVGAFLLGGLVGALAFRHIGYTAVFGVAAILLALSLRPTLYDLRVRIRLGRAKA